LKGEATSSEFYRDFPLRLHTDSAIIIIIII
jgi:hypothetical protein